MQLVLPSEIRLIDLVHTASEKMAQLAGFEAVVGQLGGESPAPSERAADVVFGIIESRVGR